MKIARMILCAVVLTFPIAALARAPYTPPGSGDAILRFSWRMSVSAKENCRLRTQAELDALPVHMRTLEVCTRDDASYLLVSRINGMPADTIHLVRGGVKGDRPLFVLKDRMLPPGRHRVRLELERITDAGTEVLAALDSTLALAEGRVQLVTLDAEARRLTARSSVH